MPVSVANTTIAFNHMASSSGFVESVSTSQPAFVPLLTVFILACFVGYFVVWNVTPALHSPLMAVTNAISSVIIVGALLASGSKVLDTSQWFGFIAIVLASINIVGGFFITVRMLALYKTKTQQKKS